MIVTIPDRAKQRATWGQGYSGIHSILRTVEIHDTCRMCGCTRGEPRLKRFCEDGEWYDCHVWTNACGHIDKYEDVILESIALANGDPDELPEQSIKEAT